eukprot:TRINITY_DN2216_c0_g2_i7.p1 TRINITY_DN2216_c0_g2~~TRINITY_DN2216_c0_g2_i7.p1  ORF type:complete len:355 (-),score=68.55 TRINITY_DN2216_c0_g2_i7:246-1310(-)
MIWEQRVPVIVMITKLNEQSKRKADRYWPKEEGTVRRYGNICVEFTVEHKRASSMVVRTFHIWKQTPDEDTSEFTDSSDAVAENAPQPEIEEAEPTPEQELEDSESSQSYDSGSSGSASPTYDIEASPASPRRLPRNVGEVRQIVQLHCTKWPDHGVPRSTQIMKDMIHELDIRKKGWDQPILVHCSAGIGRTGTFVAIHMCLNKDLHGLDYNIFDIVRHLRDQRLGMVQSVEQYKFVYSVVKDMVLDRKQTRTWVPTIHQPLVLGRKTEPNRANVKPNFLSMSFTSDFPHLDEVCLQVDGDAEDEDDNACVMKGGGREGDEHRCRALSAVNLHFPYSGYGRSKSASILPPSMK